ncbi:MAG: DUF1365 domain-containing protein [Hyphomicrobiaceae bacterium]|nr:DUF1365 domain-containing protein [Hyphomicrobiaceae bacterium]
MNQFRSSIYEGIVVHRRLSPVVNGFSYRVFTLCLDVDEIERLDKYLRVFSRNRRNVVSVYDRDLGAPGVGSIGDKVRLMLREIGLDRFASRIDLVCYPRLFGYVFNPLSVYFCKDSTDQIGAVIYEVSNTMGERKSYVIPVLTSGDAISQSCQKELYVSPFTASAGQYGFHALPPGERVVIGVNFRENGLPILKTHFRGRRRPITDMAIADLVLRYPLMTMKVMTAIHLEALKLWLKGVPIKERRVSPAYSYVLVDPAGGAPRHA